MPPTSSAPKKKSNGRMYFNEEAFQENLYEYQRTTVVRDGVSIYKNEVLERRLVDEVTKIVNAIIVVYKYYLFEDYEDLRQHALNACYTNFLKFNPQKGTCFNYFSIISKISLLNYTDRRKKHRNHLDITDQVHIEGSEYVDYDRIIDNLEDTLFGIIDEHYLGDTRKKYVKIASLLVGYLRNTKKFQGKSDMYAWCRGYGIKNTEVREFVKEMGNYNTYIFEGVL